MSRVRILDDPPDARWSLARASISAVELAQLTVFGRVGDALQALSTYAAPDIALIDLKLPVVAASA